MRSHRYAKSSFAVILVGIALALTQTSLAVAAEKGEPNDSVKELLQKRLAALAEIHKLLNDGFKSGQVSLDRIIKSRVALLRAKLEQCETKPDRIKVHEEMVQAAEELLESVKKLHAVGQAGRVEILESEVQLLEARLALERVRKSQ